MHRMKVPAICLMLTLSTAGAALGVPNISSNAAASAQAQAPLPAPTVTTGIIEGAPYRIDIPEQWNGDLVVLMHGYEPAGFPRDEPWPQNEAAPVFLQKGYAVAASAYSSQGWAVAEAIADSERLRQHFISSQRQPRHTYAVGFSLGGFVALASLEQHGKQYDGALSLCGINLPASEVFDDGIMTPLVALEYFFPKAIPLATAGLVDPNSPPMLDPEAIDIQFQTDEALAAILSKRLQIPRPMLPGAMMLNYLALREMQRRAGGQPVDNTATEYSGFGDDEAFNRGVRRYTGSASAMAYLTGNFQLTGRIQKPVVVQSNVVDPTVPLRFATRYPELVQAAGSDKHLEVMPAVGDGHCNFTPEQIGKALDTLVKK